MLEMLRAVGAEVSFKNGTAEIAARGPLKSVVPSKHAKAMRASILLAGPLAARTGKVHIAKPGGCVIGARATSSHAYAFTQLGCTYRTTSSGVHIKGPVRPSLFNLPEMSVTATENALMAASLSPGLTKIRLAAYEPHVVDLCHFLCALGVRIEGIGTHTLRIRGKKNLAGAHHTVTTDYLEAGTFALAALVTRGDVRIEGVVPKQLVSFFTQLACMGVRCTIEKKAIHMHPTRSFTGADVKTAVFPGFPTDLQAPLGVALCLARGESTIFETLFEGRLGYLAELEKMGAQVTILNPHQARISGVKSLTAASVSSNDLRAGAAMVLAALSAKGTSEVFGIDYIDRGYETFEEKLRTLGADISRVA